ncbi:hypothetical protein [Frankia sp. AgB32]|uniref:hypothetical protein n=1 Tax=Frankia sp. AgB32 TaxID=631119 RepID=UPI00200BEE13|nr:hypothetical protein [Frankia sp. AgB32]MCK9897043.1 hypothetical protein [Frankia sp. AgB32]
MRLSNVPSWRLEVGGAQVLDMALFLRDVAQLIVPQAEDAPSGQVARSAGDAGAVPASGPAGYPLNADDRRTVGADWLRWWRELVRFEADPEPTHDPESVPESAASAARSPGARWRRRQARQENVFDPPTFAALEPWPHLRRLAALGFTDARDWSNQASQAPAGTNSPALVSWDLINEVVAATMSDHHLAPDQIHGKLIVLNVTDDWSHRPRPGIALCSLSVAHDPATVSTLLRDTLAPGNHQ